MRIKLPKNQVPLFLEKSQPTRLIDVWLGEKTEVSEFFKEYDLDFNGGKFTIGVDKVMLLILISGVQLWTSFYRYSDDKYKEAMNSIGGKIDLY